MKSVRWVLPAVAISMIAAGVVSINLADEEAFKITTLDAPAGSEKSRFRVTGEENPARAIFENVNVGIGVPNPTEDLEVAGAVKLGNADGVADGTIRWTGTDFEGRKGGQWVSLTFTGPPIEEGEIIPCPEGAIHDSNTRIAKKEFDGAAYMLHRGVRFNRILIRFASKTDAPTLRVLIYQAPGGGSGVANLKASVEGFAVPGVGTATLTLSQGTVQLEAGIFYILWGRDSATGSFQANTYGVRNAQLLSVNVDPNTHPIAFTTAISASTTPATFNPLHTPNGNTSATTFEVPLIVRFRKE